MRTYAIPPCGSEGMSVWQLYTVEAVLKDHLTGHKYVVSQGRCSLVTGSVTLVGISGLSRHGSGLARKVSLYMYLASISIHLWVHYIYQS